MAAEFTKDSFEADVIGSEKPVLVDFLVAGLTSLQTTVVQSLTNLQQRTMENRLSAK